jgi:hypothetical protein
MDSKRFVVSLLLIIATMFGDISTSVAAVHHQESMPQTMREAMHETMQHAAQGTTQEAGTPDHCDEMGHAPSHCNPTPASPDSLSAQEHVTSCPHDSTACCLSISCTISGIALLEDSFRWPNSAIDVAYANRRSVFYIPHNPANIFRPPIA